MRTEVKLLAEKDGEFLVNGEEEKFFPGAEVEDAGRRWDAGRKILDVEELQDVVRLGLKGDEEREYYVLHGTLDQVPEGFKTIAPDEFREHDWREDDGYMIVPVKHTGAYLSERHDYSGGAEIDVVKTVIRNSRGEILAVKKSHLEKVSSGERFKKYGEMSGKWELPGGRIGKHPGETTRFEAARREISEEVGIELGEAQDLLKIEVEEVNTVNAYMLLYDDWDGEVRLSEEHSDYRWVEPGNFGDLEWHRDAGYGIPLIEGLEEHLEREEDSQGGGKDQQRD